MPQKIVLFAGSLRTNSLNKKLVLVAHEILKKNAQFQTEIFDLKNLNLPVYDGDIEEKGMPQGLVEFSETIRSCQGLIISSPEYNGSISSCLKNTIDWVSRVRPQPFERKPILLLAATPGGLGAIRGLLHTRVPLDALEAFVFPQTFGLPKADENLKSGLTIEDPRLQKRLEAVIEKYLLAVKSLS